MYKLTLENTDNDQIIFNQLGGDYTITAIQGLNPPDATINTNTTALADGGSFNSAKVNMRTINLAFAIEKNVEANRVAMYNVIRIKQPITLYYQSDLLDLFIEGYVEKLQVDYGAMKQIATVTILCPFPYFKNAQEIINELSAVTKMFHFPFHSLAGKNLLENTANTTTSQDITFTVNSDGSIKVNGTATANAYLIIGAVNLRAGVTYILSGCPSGGGGNTYRLYWQGVSGNYDEGNGTTYTPTEDTTINIRMVVYSGCTVDNLTFYPMVRVAQAVNDSYQPYGYKDIVFGEIDPVSSTTVINGGTIETGLTFELYAKTPITNPKIYNYVTQEYLGLNFSMLAGDLITIKTGSGEKSITLLRGGVTTNIFNNLQRGSTWLQLPPKAGTFVYTIESGQIVNLSVTIKHYDLFEGV